MGRRGGSPAGVSRQLHGRQWCSGRPGWYAGRQRFRPARLVCWAALVPARAGVTWAAGELAAGSPTGGGASATAASDQSDPNLIEVAIYGIAALYERYPPKQPAKPEGRRQSGSARASRRGPTEVTNDPDSHRREEHQPSLPPIERLQPRSQYMALKLKEFDFKGFLLEKGERVGLYAAGGIALSDGRPQPVPAGQGAPQPLPKEAS